ncbi:hypothetical protein GIB67_033115 [Kingdonia uniflora]|uniref:Uncharacterized protein n=1 Tax=Kingdonia uniflora TaxID=39325 RepID=A0A7J7MYM1_9MAGN|nr:hypothetical protein GIB67_033115 [Kingdonia uniflora]
MIEPLFRTSAGVGFAIPSSTVLKIVPQLIQFNKVVGAGLNLEIAPDLVANQLNVRNGALVLQVPGNSLAAKAGILPTTRGFAGNIVLGDVIAAVDKKQGFSFFLFLGIRVSKLFKLEKYISVGDVELVMMFTPQRKNWFVTPQRNGSGSKEKGVLDGPSPPTASLGGENGKNGDGSGEREVWNSFKEAGLLDEASLARKDRQAIVERVSKLENELFEYQYNMGLLLIEKKDWTSKFEELGQALAETQDLLKREQAAHLTAVSDLERRGENLRKAFGVEKQCVADLEKALHEMRAESAEMKYTSETKMAEAEALVASIGEKSLEVEAKIHAADAKLAEASRKSSEIERKLKELEARESSHRTERQSLNAERGLHESDLSKQREELRNWERTLQEREDRLVEGGRILNQREERANENDMTSKQREKDLEEALKKIEKTNLFVKKREDDVNIRLSKISEKEGEIDAMKKSVEAKEKELQAVEEKLNDRERVEIQKLLDEHNVILELKKREFHLEIDHKRKALDVELKDKVSAVELKEIEINHMEEKIGKREQALEKKLEKSKEKEREFELKFNALKETDKSIKSEVKNLEIDKKQMVTDKERLQILIVELEKKRADIEEEQLRLQKEVESLKLTEEERSEHLRLKSELKQEIDKCKHREELLLKEHESLKQEKENFEREWEILDEKRMEIKKELSQISEARTSFDKMKHSEEESLKNMKLSTEDYVKGEMEAIKQQKESFEALMEHERSVIAERVQREHEDMVRDFELRKRELETEMQNKREEMEKQLKERERAFEEQKERDLDNISYLKEVTGRDMEDMKLERARIKNEKQQVEADRQHLERQQLDIRRDIESLDNLIKKLKHQKEKFKKFVENYKSCKKCGEINSDFILYDLQSLEEMNNVEVPLQRRPEDYLKHLDPSGGPNNPTTPSQVGFGSNASGEMSFFRRCAQKILSPLKKTTVELPVTVNKETNEGILGSQNASLGTEIEFSDAQRIQSDNSNIDSKAAEVVEDSQSSEPKNGRRGKARVKRKTRTGIKKTRSMKAVVEEAKAFLGEALEPNEDNELNGNTINKDTRGDSSIANKSARPSRRKRQRDDEYKPTASEQKADGHEARSDSATTGGRKKNRQAVAPEVQPPGETRYNLRPLKIAGNAARALVLPDPKKKGKEKEAAEGVKVVSDEERLSKTITGVVPSQEAAIDDGRNTHLMQETTLNRSMEVHELSVDRVVRGNMRIICVISKQFEAVAINDSLNGEATNLADNMELSEEVNGTTEGVGEYGNDEDEYESEVGEHGAEDDVDDEDDKEEHPGEASVGKRLWTFFTT